MSVRTTTGGIFFDSTDGLEPFFGSDAIDTLTPEGLTAKLSATPNDTPTLGKVVDPDGFYLAVPVSAAHAADYTAGASYSVTYTRAGATLSMRLDRISLSADGTDALLILHGDACPVGLDASRRQSVVVARTAVSGLSLPVDALYTEGDRTFVYVEQGGKAAVREVEVLYRRDGVVLIDPQEKEGYLADGEAVLITERRLYEGRVIRA